MEASEPSDQLGSLQKPPWAGLWALPHVDLGDTDWEFTGNAPAVGLIVVIQKDYVVDLYTYESEEELREAWAAFEETINSIPKEPKGTDIIIWSVNYFSERAWNVGHKDAWPHSINMAGTYTRFDNALQFAKDCAGGGDVWLYDGESYELLPDEETEHTD